MFVIENGREQFYQWDVNQRLIVADNSINEVHFCNKLAENALVVVVKDENGKRVAEVPNILLQEDWDIKAYAVCDDCSRYCKEFKVIARSKPADYVYTETEVKRYEKYVEQIENHETRITTLEGVGGSNKFIKIYDKELSEETTTIQFIADGLYDNQFKELYICGDYPSISSGSRSGYLEITYDDNGKNEVIKSGTESLISTSARRAKYIIKNDGGIAEMLYSATSSSGKSTLSILNYGANFIDEKAKIKGAKFYCSSKFPIYTYFVVFAR